MSKTGRKTLERPNLAQIEAEISRVKYKSGFGRAVRSTIYVLAVVAAVAVLVATLWMPVLQITGMSMSPTMEDGQIVLCIKSSEFDTGEPVAFYYNNKILVKRIIASAGSWVDIDEQGNVYVDGHLLEEPYLREKAFGECNIELPYQVPDGKVFVMGDDRAVSLDSRTTAVGCVSSEQLLGQVKFRIWPFAAFGPIN